MFIGYKILIVEQLVIQWRLFKTRLLLEKLQEDVCQICLFIYCFVANKYLALFCLPLGSFTWKNFISFAKVGIFLIRNVACAMLIGWKILIGEQLTIQWRLFKTWLLLEKLQQDICQICVFIYCFASNKYLALFCLPLGSFTCKKLYFICKRENISNKECSLLNVYWIQDPDCRVASNTMALIQDQAFVRETSGRCLSDLSLYLLFCSK